MFRRFGSEVTVLERGPRLLGHEDEDVSSGIRDILTGEGIKVQVNAECIELLKAGDEIEAQTNCAEGSRIRGTHD